LLKKAHNEKINIELTEDMALYIAGNIDSNVRDLEVFANDKFVSSCAIKIAICRANTVCCFRLFELRSDMIMP
jgi:chromosomal replication initiation ATPase DnaA